MLNHEQRESMKKRATAERDAAIARVTKEANDRLAVQLEMLKWFDDGHGSVNGVHRPSTGPDANGPPAGVTEAVRVYIRTAPDTFDFNQVIDAAKAMGVEGERPTFAAAIARAVADRLIVRTVRGKVNTPAVYRRIIP